MLFPGQGYVQGLTDAFFIRERSYNFYGQDSWRVRPNLTVTARFAMGSGAGAGHGKQAHAGARPRDWATSLRTDRCSRPAPRSLTTTCSSNLSSTTQLVPGGSSNGKPFWNTQYNNLAPSIGVAWQPDSKTVVRSGYSISYVRDTLTIISNVTTSNLGLHTGVAVTPAAGDPLAVLNPSVNQVLPPPPFAVPQSQYKNFLASFSSTGGSGIYAIDPNLRTPYVQQWSFGIQRELSPPWRSKSATSGNHATGMYRGDDLEPAEHDSGAAFGVSTSGHKPLGLQRESRGLHRLRHGRAPLRQSRLAGPGVRSRFWRRSISRPRSIRAPRSRTSSTPASSRPASSGIW